MNCVPSTLTLAPPLAIPVNGYCAIIVPVAYLVAVPESIAGPL